MLNIKEFDTDVTLSQDIFKPLNEIPIAEDERIEANILIFLNTIPFTYFLFFLKISENQETESFLENMYQLDDIESDGLENFGGYLISKMGLTQFGFRTHEGKDQDYTYVNLLSEVLVQF